MMAAQGQVSCWEVPQAGTAQKHMRQSPQPPVNLPPAPVLPSQLFYEPTQCVVSQSGCVAATSFRGTCYNGVPVRVVSSSNALLPSSAKFANCARHVCNRPVQAATARCTSMLYSWMLSVTMRPASALDVTGGHSCANATPS